jgi:cation diffusion facilitator family transporter
LSRPRVDDTSLVMDLGAAKKRDEALLRRAMSLSLGIGLFLFLVKFGAFWITGSAAIFADAAESAIHIVAVGFAYFSLRLSQKPADEGHPYGHAKVSFFSAGFEGAMIVLAALFIIYDAINKWITGLHLENLGVGVLLIAGSVIVNIALGLYLVWTGKQKHSLILEANGKHILTDAWTSIGVLVGLGLTLLTGWLPWDPIFAIVVALNILYTGFGLIRKSVGGLMDVAEPEVHRQLEHLLDRETSGLGIDYHQLRHRNLGDGHWVDLHLLFDDETSIRDAHTKATTIENLIKETLKPSAIVTTHLEPKKDHVRIHGEPGSRG